MNDKEPLNLRSEEVNEILSRPPHWLVRWGVGSILLLLMLFTGLSWYIKYPDVVEGRVVLTTPTPPVKLFSRSSGQLQQLFFKEGDAVQKGDFIAAVNSPLQPSAVEYLREIHQKIQSCLVIEGPIEQLGFKDAGLVFGSIQDDYSQLKNTFQEFLRLQNDPFRQRNAQQLRNQISHHQELNRINQRQLTLVQKDVKNAASRFKSDQSLYEKEFLSKKELVERETAYNLVQQQEENLRKAVVQNEIAVTGFQKQLLELEERSSDKQRALHDQMSIQLNSIQNFLDVWQQEYVLVAPSRGTLTFLSHLVENQFVDANQPLFAIVPEATEILGQVEVPSNGFGKVAVGQKVQLQLSNFPFHEFGQVVGTVQSIRLIPGTDPKTKESTYQATIDLPNGLTSTYGHKLKYLPEMSGTARIITQDLRLIDRILQQFRRRLGE